ncbi:MAG: vWA domain-containing protein [Zavarzinella sp.]
MAQLKDVVDPFGEVNVRIAPGGKVRVTATILMEPNKEGAQTGIALDGSGSMSQWYGVNSGATLSPVFGKATANNIITPVAQKICSYLARKIDADGGTTCIYWSIGPGGSEIEVIGDLTAAEAEKHQFRAPANFGTGTQLLPALRYFLERFEDAPWGFYVFVTDGEVHDFDEVKSYTIRLSEKIAAGKRNPVKLILLGVGNDVDTEQMRELDDLDTEVDLWDHKLASELRVLEQIFAEVVDKNARVAPKGRIVDPNGKVLKDYEDTGVPAYIEFDAPASIPFFTLEIPGFRIHQSLMDGKPAPKTEETAPFAQPVGQLPDAEQEIQPQPEKVPEATHLPGAEEPPTVTKETEQSFEDAVARDTGTTQDRELDITEELDKPKDPELDFELEFDKPPDIDLEER